jgi:hypothetical protein
LEQKAKDKEKKLWRWLNIEDTNLEQKAKDKEKKL